MPPSCALLCAFAIDHGLRCYVSATLVCHIHKALRHVDDRPHCVGPCRREGVFFPIDNAYISGTTRAIFAKFLYMLPISVARSFSDTFTIGRIAYCLEWVFFPIENASLAGKGGRECTARAKYAIYDCLVIFRYKARLIV